MRFDLDLPILKTFSVTHQLIGPAEHLFDRGSCFGFGGGAEVTWSAFWAINHRFETVLDRTSHRYSSCWLAHEVARATPVHAPWCCGRMAALFIMHAGELQIVFVWIDGSKAIRQAIR